MRSTNSSARFDRFPAEVVLDLVVALLFTVRWCCTQGHFFFSAQQLASRKQTRRACVNKSSSPVQRDKSQLQPLLETRHSTRPDHPYYSSHLHQAPIRMDVPPIQCSCPTPEGVLNCPSIWAALEDAWVVVHRVWEILMESWALRFTWRCLQFSLCMYAFGFAFRALDHAYGTWIDVRAGRAARTSAIGQEHEK